MDRQTFVEEVNQKLPPHVPPVTLDRIKWLVARDLLPSGELYHSHVRQAVALETTFVEQQQRESRSPKVGMDRYETEEQVADALGAKPEEVVAAMSEAGIHLPLSDADLKEIRPHLGPHVRKSRDPFRNAFSHAFDESLRRSLEHRKDTAAIRREVFGHLDIPLAIEEAEAWAAREAARLGKEACSIKWEVFGLWLVPFSTMKEAEAWIAQEVERQGPVEDIDYSPNPDAWELWRGRKRPLWAVWLRWEDENGQERSCWVAKGGALDRLRIGSEELAGKIGCPVARTTTHILTGKVPVVPLIEPRAIWKGRDLDGFMIQVNYPWIPTELVRTYYAEFKRIYTQPTEFRRPKRRPSPKAADVRAFFQTRTGLTWPQKLLEWNRHNPDQQYSSWQALQATYRRG